MCLPEVYPRTSLEGEGRIYKRLSFYYEAQIEDDDTVKLKKAFAVLKTGSVSWELGKDTVWLGHGYHGSFLLSDNAEGFFLFKFKTDEPFRLPWIFSGIGEFRYELFHGWLDELNIIGHRLSIKPIQYVEFGANQTVVYDKGRGYKLTEYPHVFVSSEENSGAKSNFDNDQRASLDLAIYMPFLSKISPFKDGKLYAEYAGEDSYAWWQKEDGKWVGPLGFDFLSSGWLYGLFLTTGKTDFRAEYAQNYVNWPLFYDWYKKSGSSTYWDFWYSKDDRFSNDGINMGHHMGSHADDLFFELSHKFNAFSFKLFYDKERHGLGAIIIDETTGVGYYNNTPEIRYQYGLIPSYKFERFNISAYFIQNYYKNVDFDNDPLVFDIRKGTNKKELIGGMSIEFDF